MNQKIRKIALRAEPLLQELTAQITGLREVVFEKIDALGRLLDERDLRYAQLADVREKAVLAALSAVDGAVKTALAQSDKATILAEQNAEKWRNNANEWRAAMTDRERNFVTKTTLWGYLGTIVGLMLTGFSLILRAWGAK